MTFDRQEAGAAPPAGASAIEHRVVLWFQMQRTLDRHGAADVTVGGVDLSTGKAKRRQKIKFRVLKGFSRNLEGFGQKLRAKRPFVENEFDVEGALQPILDFADFYLGESFAAEAFVIDVGSAAKAPMACGVGGNIVDLGLSVSEGAQSGRNGLVDDFEIAAAGESLEFDEREIRFDPRRVAVHEETNRAGRGDGAYLRIAIAMPVAHGESPFPGRFDPCRNCRGPKCLDIQRDG